MKNTKFVTKLLLKSQANQSDRSFLKSDVSEVLMVALIGDFEQKNEEQMSKRANERKSKEQRANFPTLHIIPAN